MNSFDRFPGITSAPDIGYGRGFVPHDFLMKKQPYRDNMFIVL